MTCITLQITLTVVLCSCMQHVMCEAVEWSCKQQPHLLQGTWRVWHHQMLAAAG